MTFEMKTPAAQQAGRVDKPPFHVDEEAIQAKLWKLEMPANVEYGWEGVILVIKDYGFKTETRWRVRHQDEEIHYEQIGLGLEYGCEVKPVEWRKRHLWRIHAVVLTVLSRHHYDEVLRHITQ